MEWVEMDNAMMKKILSGDIYLTEWTVAKILELVRDFERELKGPSPL